MVGPGLGARVAEFGRTHPVLTFVILTFLVSYSVGVAGLLLRPAIAAWTSSEVAAHYLSRIGVTGAPALIALLLTRASSGPQGVHALWRSLHPNRSSRWIGLVIVAFAACSALACLIAGADMAQLRAASQTWPRFVVHFVLEFIIIGCGEELGWRGWLLPQLLRRYQTGSATILVAAIWGVWHVPILLTGVRHALLFLFGVLGLSFLFTALWVRFDRNVFATAVAHASVNAPLAWLGDSAVSPMVPSLHLSSAWEIALGIYGVAGLLVFIWDRRVFESRIRASHPNGQSPHDLESTAANCPRR